MDYNLIPYPQRIVKKEGEYRKGLACVFDKKDALLNSVEDLFKRESKNGKLILTYDETVADEGYFLSITPEKVEIKAKDNRGHYYGACTLKQLRKQFGKHLPCLEIEDFPISKHRGIQVNYGQANVRFKRDWLCYFIKKCGEWRINELYLYFEWNYSFESVKGLSNPFYANRTDMEYIIEFARGYNIEIIPEFNFLGHSALLSTKEKFSSIMETAVQGLPNPQSKDICVGNEESYTFLEKLMDEICEIFPSPVIHIGGDEIAHVGLCEACAPEKEKYGVLGMYLKHFKHLSNYMKARGKKIGLWGDVILSLCDGSPFWENRDTEPQFAEQNLALLYEFKDNLVVYDWWYFGVSKISLDFFRKHGIETMASTSTMGCYCSCLNPGQYENTYNYFEYAQQVGTRGTLITDWINHLGYHAEHMTAHFAAASAISWSGCKDGFSDGVSYDEFLKEFCLREYGTEKMAEYIKFTGSFDSPLLAPFDVHFRGVGLRHVVFQAHEPIALYCKTYPFLSKDGAFSAYTKQVERLEKEWQAIVCCFKNKYNKVMELPVLLHTVLRDYYEIMYDVHQKYHKASLLQYEDDKVFKATLDDCAKCVLKLLPIYERVLAYVKVGFALLGNDYATILRIQEMKKNIVKWSKFLKGLEDNHRPLPTFGEMSKCLFGSFPVDLYNMGEMDWFTEKASFRNTDYYNDGSVFVNGVECFNVCQNV